ncbi:MAG TPA: hypothetical protein ENJ55_05980 [Rhizobiales bacterium]|nr:hypothetical protein [Hyphomicrobiales bacterium]
MPDTHPAFKRVSGLEGIAIAGRFGAAGNQAVCISVCPPRDVVFITALNGQTGNLKKQLKKHCGADLPGPGRSSSGKSCTVHWAGPNQWYVVGTCDLTGKLAGIASQVDQSHGRITIVVSGENARHVLAKGTPVDLHPDVFRARHCALTEMAHISVHLAKTADNEFEISLYRGFAESFWEWLCEMSQEFGYQVK